MCIIIYNMGGESQKKWLGVGKLQKFKCNLQVQKNLLDFFCLLASSYIGIIKCFSGVSSHKIGHRKIPAEHKKEREGQ